MIPTMLFSIKRDGLDFLAEDDKDEHQDKKSDGCQEVEEVGHGVCGFGVLV